MDDEQMAMLVIGVLAGAAIGAAMMWAFQNGNLGNTSITDFTRDEQGRIVQIVEK